MPAAMVARPQALRPWSANGLILNGEAIVRNGLMPYAINPAYPTAQARDSTAASSVYFKGENLPE